MVWREDFVRAVALRTLDEAPNLSPTAREAREGWGGGAGKIRDPANNPQERLSLQNELISALDPFVSTRFLHANRCPLRLKTL